MKRAVAALFLFTLSASAQTSDEITFRRTFLLKNVTGTHSNPGDAPHHPHLFERGAWTAFYEGQFRRRVALPTYPFQRGRFRLGVTDEDAEASLVFWTPGTQHILPVQHFEPRNEYEEIMVDIWRELFGLEKVSIYHNFFHLGGDSLLAVQMVSRIRERFKVEVPLRALWAVRTVAQFALLVAEYREKQGVPQEAIHADRTAAAEFAGEVDLGVDDLSDAEVEAMLAALGEETEMTA